MTERTAYREDVENLPRMTREQAVAFDGTPVYEPRER
jgi:hypothetical protein